MLKAWPRDCSFPHGKDLTEIPMTLCSLARAVDKISYFWPVFRRNYNTRTLLLWNARWKSDCWWPSV